VLNKGSTQSAGVQIDAGPGDSAAGIIDEVVDDPGGRAGRGGLDADGVIIVPEIVPVDLWIVVGDANAVEAGAAEWLWMLLR
jgi:hypothetical protein